MLELRRNFTGDTDLECAICDTYLCAFVGIHNKIDNVLVVLQTTQYFDIVIGDGVCSPSHEASYPQSL